jgi:hypothetical protein
MSATVARVKIAIANALNSDPAYKPSGLNLDKIAHAAIEAMGGARYGGYAWFARPDTLTFQVTNPSPHPMKVTVTGVDYVR